MTAGRLLERLVKSDGNPMVKQRRTGGTMNSRMKNVMMLGLAALMLSGASAVWAADDSRHDADAVCCDDGGECQAGEACCIRKDPAAPCSGSMAAYCTSEIGLCIPID